ncbi:MAG: ABC transporter permease, partial [Blastocatellia bacterium]|nr:ABC transporter permease [Blastocatellia bacterium]
MINILLQHWRQLLSLLRRRKHEREMEEEMRFHLEMQFEQNLEAGMETEEASYAARRQFGNQTWLKEVSREMWSLNSIETLIHDLRYGARMLLKNPGFTAVAVLTLALGIGANSAIFSVISALLLRPLPFTEPGKLVQVWETDAKIGKNDMEASYPNFADWREQNHVFEQIAAYSDVDYTLTGTAEPEQIQGAFVSPAFFPMLAINPTLGRVFAPEEDYPNKVFSVVISESLWRRR